MLGSCFIDSSPTEFIDHIVIHLIRIDVVGNAFQRNNLISQSGTGEIILQAQIVTTTHRHGKINRTFPTLHGIGVDNVQRSYFAHRKTPLIGKIGNNARNDTIFQLRRYRTRSDGRIGVYRDIELVRG